MPELHTSELAEFCRAVQQAGVNFEDPALSSRYYPLELKYDTVVDQSLSPYSREYYDQQVALYTEISGRELKQEEGELHRDDIVPLLSTANPLGITDGAHGAEYVRTLSTLLSLSTISGSADILDMGAGHGLSSEVFAFTGCKVHAIDIDPNLANLSRQRAATRGLDIKRSDMNFDDLDAIENDKYAAAFFFQSLHHCLRPWELIEQLKPKLKADGVIGFAGEPVQEIWWKHWGLRLDQMSLYVAHDAGWFESGWSYGFIRDCFERNEMTLTFISGGMHGGEFGIATADEKKREAVLAKAALLGLREVYAGVKLDEYIEMSQRSFLSLVGVPAKVLGVSGFRQAAAGEGVLLYGPYIALKAGTYELTVIVERDASGEEHATGGIILDVASEYGTTIHFQEMFDSAKFAEPQVIVRRFVLERDVSNVEFRVTVTGNGRWGLTIPTIRPLAL